MTAQPDARDSDDGPSPSLDARSVDGELVVTVGGTWSLFESAPAWTETVDRATATDGALRSVRLRAEDLGAWDSSLLLLLRRARSWCDARGIPCRLEGFPEQVERLLELARRAADGPARGAGDETPLALRVGRRVLGEARAALEFTGELVLSTAHTVARPRRFPWRSWLEQLRACGPGALPIVGLISLLVGVIVAYQGAVQLRKFGAEIYIADLVGLSVVREMAPVMAAIVIAGRTGSAFAAELGEMVVGGEVDALRVTGVSPMAFLVVPRVAALLPMGPLLTLYADGLGLFGGMLTTTATLGVSPAAFWARTQSALVPADLAVGLIKSVVFALLVGAAGCMRGLRSRRSSAGVGAAATSAAVTGIFLVVLADAVFGEVFEILRM